MKIILYYLDRFIRLLHQQLASMVATDPESESKLPSASRIGRVALRVNDLDRLVDFYETGVGLEVQRHDSERAVLGAGEALLELIADPDTPQRRSDESGLFHTAFRVPSRAALADALSRVQERGQLDGASDHLVSEALYLSDPEDNGIEIYCDRPREEWPDEDGGVGMETLPLDLSEFRGLGQDETTVPSETTVGHVHLEVSSLAESRAFYVDGLGMRVRDRYDDEALFVAAGEYHHHVGLNTWNNRTEPRAGRGLQWFELVLPDEEALDSVQTRFEQHGTDVAVTEEGITVTDPDGIEVRLRVET
jgi:catechol 2,3-dioxygenase